MNVVCSVPLRGSIRPAVTCHIAVSQVIIDTQWGAFGDNGTVDFFKTEFDRAVDAHSHHTGSFT